jgi:polyisoprenoid-binding protein YceI
MNYKALNFKTKICSFSHLSWGKNLFLLAILLGFSMAVSASEYTVDKVASHIKWEAKKVTGKHTGSILFGNGAVSVTDNKISGGTFIVDMKTIVDEDIADAGMKSKLMGHLASDDFFSIVKFPESNMVIKKVTPIAGDEYRFLVDLTIKGVTNPLEFTAKVNINGDQLNAEGIITINRTLYGIKYGSGSFFQGLGDKMIYDDFTLTFNLVAQKK